MPTAMLRLEAIGDDGDQLRREISSFMQGLGYGDQGRWPARYFVARVTGTHAQFKLNREFLSGHKDYSQANSVGSRGVWVTYFLEEGELYDVKEPLSWKHKDRYFCTVRDGEIVRVDDDEAEKWAERLDDGERLEWLENQD